MAKKRAFISFDFDHDNGLRGSFVSQAKRSDSPFNITDWSVKEPINEKWKKKVRDIIRRTDLTIVICGRYTHTAKGVAAELAITREENKPYFLLKGRPDYTCTKPGMARHSDKIYKWKWKHLGRLINGEQWPNVTAVQ